MTDERSSKYPHSLTQGSLTQESTCSSLYSSLTNYLGYAPELFHEEIKNFWRPINRGLLITIWKHSHENCLEIQARDSLNKYMSANNGSIYIDLDKLETSSTAAVYATVITGSARSSSRIIRLSVNDLSITNFQISSYTNGYLDYILEGEND